MAPVSSAELNNTVRKVATRAGPALPTSTEPQLREKLSLSDLVAPVSDDLEILNENLQKVGLFFRGITSLLLQSDTFWQKLSTRNVDCFKRASNLRCLLQVVGADNEMLMSAARQIFGAGGKRMRPALVFLVSRATSQLSGLEYVVFCDEN